MWDERYEQIRGHNWYKPLYRIEKKYAKLRFELVSAYINDNVKPGMVVADIGCGNGTYFELLRACGAKIIGLDIMPMAGVMLHDIVREPIPPVDLALCIGVLPYHKDYISILRNILPYTDKLLFDFLDKHSPTNILRRIIRPLNVRGVHFQDKWQMGWALMGGYIKYTKRGTGWMVEWKAGENHISPLFA